MIPFFSLYIIQKGLQFKEVFLFEYGFRKEEKEESVMGQAYKWYALY
jgi:hypothetical protein